MECIFCLNENAYFDGVNYVCPDCGREWPCDEIADDDDDNNKLRCPECGSHLVYPDSSGINDYACDACGCRWDGDDDDYDEDYDDDEEDDISETLRKYKDYIGHVHIAENHRYQPGTGSIDFKRHMQTLKEIGFDGAVVNEGRIRGENPLEAYQKSVTYMKQFI